MPFSLPASPFFGPAVRLLSLLLSLAGFAAAADAPRSVNIAWNANPESDIAGYKVLYGFSSGVLNQSLSVGTTPAATLPNLEAGRTYYCAVKAFNSGGYDSSLSSEVSFLIPADPAPEIAIVLAPAISLASGAAVNFGEVETGLTSAAKTFTISNTGDADLTGLAITLDGTGAADFTATPLPATLASGASVSFSVTFKPSAGSAISARLRVASNDADENPFDISLSGTGIQFPEIAIETSAGSSLVDGESSFNFESPPTGGATSETFTIRNSGKGLLTGLAISIDGANSGDFSVSAPRATSLLSEGSTTFQVSFVPSGNGVRTAKLHISSNDADEGIFDINLIGNGIPVPGISVTRNDGTRLISGSGNIPFANTIVGTPAVAENLTIQNLGQVDLTGLKLSIEGSNPSDFTVDSLATTTLAPSAGTAFKITFKPTATGARRATLNITSNDPDEPSFLLNLTGTGIVIPDITVAAADGTNLQDGAATAAFGNSILGSTGTTVSWMIGNNGTASLTGIAATIDGSHASDFTVTTVPPTTLTIGATAAIKVTFKPSAAGTRTASLRIASNDPDENPFDISLSGTGVAVPEIAVLKAGVTDLVDGTSSLPFGSANLGTTTAAETLVIKNLGTANLAGLAVSLSGANTADFKLTTLGTTSLAPGASTSIAVSFAPLAAGSRSAVLSIASNDADENPFEITLTGTGIALPEIAVTGPDSAELIDGQSSVDFASVNLGNSSVAKGIVIRNTGTATLTGLSLVLDGNHAGDFTVSALSSNQLAPGASTTLLVSFKPTASGARSAAMHIGSNDSDENPFDISLTGGGIALPEIVVTRAGSINLTDGAASVPFGTVNLGSSSSSQSFLITNSGTAALTGLALTVDGTGRADFTASSLNVTSLAPGASTAFSVGFTPSAAGIRVAAFHISSNDSDENPFDVTLIGTGLAVPEIAITGPDSSNLVDAASTLTFPGVALGSPTVSQTIVISNTGTAALTGLSASLTGIGRADFSIDTLPSALAAGAKASFVISFKPATAGARNALLSITSNDADENPFELALSGTGVPVPILALENLDGTPLNPSELQFGDSILGEETVSRTIVIRNAGTADLDNLLVTTTGPGASSFLPVAPSVTTLAPGDSTPLKITFDPKSAGLKSASLVVVGESCDPLQVAMAGKGLAVPHIGVIGGDGQRLIRGFATTDFGKAKVGTPAIRTFVILNTGTAPLANIAVSISGPGAPDFVLGALGSTRVAPGGRTTFKVTFNPTKGTSRSATIAIASNDPEINPFLIDLDGTGLTAPKITVTQGSKSLDDDDASNFGSVHGSKAMVFTITNTGSAALTGISVSKNGIHSQDFALGGLKSKSLAPGKSMDFKLTFNPSSTGIRWGAIHISSNDTDEKFFDIILTGKGTSKPVKKKKIRARNVPPFKGPTGGDDSEPSTKGVEVLDGHRYKTLEISRTDLADGTDISPEAVEVSSNLLDWFSGDEHTTVVIDNASTLKVRDNTPVGPGAKRYIRLRK